MQEWMSSLPSGGAWTVIAFFLFLIWGAPAVLSKEGAGKLWVVGRVAQMLSSRRERAVQKEVRIETTRADYLEGLIRELRSDLNEERELARIRERELRRDVDMAWGYVAWATDWSRQVIQLAAQHGWKPPLPEWLTPDEWKMRPKNSGN